MLEVPADCRRTALRLPSGLRDQLADNGRPLARNMPELIPVAQLVLTKDEFEMPADRFGMAQAVRRWTSPGYPVGSQCFVAIAIAPAKNWFQREGRDVGEETGAGAVDTALRGQSQSFAAAMLVVACVCWAAFFSLCKNWLEAAHACPCGNLVASLTLLGVRTVIALATFVVFKPRLFLKPSRRELAVGLLLGTLNCLGNILQVWGLASTSPALSSFFTSLASLWVPILALVLFRLPVARVTWAGMALGIVGLAILGIDWGASWGMGFGDGLTVMSSLAFAFFILSLDRLGRTVNSSHLTLVLIAVSGLPSLFLAVCIAAWQGKLISWLIWLMEMLGQPAIARDVLLLTMLTTILATHLMSTYQPRVPVGRAALIYLLEPVFAAVLSIVVGHDSVTGRLLLGGTLVLCGNALVELPVLIRDLRGKRRE
jgi:drug/metabolite transporter (DMT)-like permease